VSFAALYLAHALFKIWLGADASHEFSAGRLNGTLELLLATPLESREVASGMLSGFRHRFLAPLAALLVMDAALVVRFWSGNDRPDAFMVGAIGAMLLVDSYCLCWVG